MNKIKRQIGHCLYRVHIRVFQLIIVLTFFSIFAAGFAGCGPDNSTATQTVTAQQGVTYSQCLVTYTAGEVYLKTTTPKTNLNTGDLVDIDDTIIVENESSCELQFNDNTAIIIQENTTIQMKSIFTKPNASDINAELLSGSVLCKVAPIAGTERFSIRTKTAAFGVRGTEFKVSYSQQAGSRVDVKKGKVAILPPAIDFAEIEKNLKGKDDTIINIIRQIEQNAPIAEENQTVVVEEEIGKDISELLNEKIKKIAAQETAAPEDIQELKGMTKNIIADYSKKVASPKDISEDSSKELESLKNVKTKEIERILEVPEKEDIEQQVSIVKNEKPDEWDKKIEDPDILNKKNASDLIKNGPAREILHPVPRRVITIDGNMNDWSNIKPAYIDQINDKDANADFIGTDIHMFYLAHDDKFLYLLMTLNDGRAAPGVLYVFQANKISRIGDTEIPESPGDHFVFATFKAGEEWRVGRQIRQREDEKDYPKGFAKPGSNFVEWKVPLSDMGDLNGKFIRIYTHYPIGEIPVSDDNITSVRIRLE